MQDTDNYYVIVTRESLPQISYSIDAIKKIVKNRKNPKLEKIYSNVGIKDITKKKYDILIVEDAKAGYRFFSKVGEDWNVSCVSANGKSGILNELSRHRAARMLVVADAAALGSEMRGLMQFISMNSADVDLFLPEILTIS